MTTSSDKAKKKYEDKRVKMTVSFNPEKETELLDFAKSINFSEWVKQKIKEEKEALK